MTEAHQHTWTILLEDKRVKLNIIFLYLSVWDEAKYDNNS